MKQKHVLVEHLHSINDIISQPLKCTQRIKFSCFDVSCSFIVFGATSGGLYIFTKENTTFLKLLPGMVGPLSLVSISEDEKNIAMANTKGLVIVIEDGFASANYDHQIYSQHEGSKVTVLKWHCSELYCGDDKGKVSVVNLPNLLTKAIFQLPSTALMQLDSSIVQMDCYQQFLLISTTTRSYICDTQKEQYRQIGKKLRDGAYGACFHYKHNLELQTLPASPRSGAFTHLKDDDDHDNTFSNHSNAELKLFCTRPGIRVWEAKLDASVTCTHQLKSALARSSVKLLQIGDEEESHLNTVNCSEWKHEENGKIHMLANRFVLIVNGSGFVAFNPENVEEPFWWNGIQGVLGTAVIRDSVYFWCENNAIRTFSLHELENLVLKCLFAKSYRMSAEICVEYASDILSCVEHSKRIHLVSILKEKLLDLGEEQLAKQLNQIFEAIQLRSQTIIGHKDALGVVSVNNLYQVKSEPSELKTEVAKEEDEVQLFQILQQQYDINKVNANIEIKKYQTLLAHTDPEALLQLFHKFSGFMRTERDVRENEMERWCQTQYLKYFSSKSSRCRIKDFDVSSPILDYISNAFRSVNLPQSSGCACAFPLPQTSNTAPAFYNIGCELLTKFCLARSERWSEIVKEVPYMWKHVISLRPNDNISAILPLLIQLSDEGVLEEFLQKFSYDTWDDSLRLLIKLKTSTCLNCDRKFTDSSETVSWSAFGTLMLKSLGGPTTIKLLGRYADNIPSGALSAEFYQTCIFSGVCGSQGVKLSKAVTIAKGFQKNEENAAEFTNLVANFLHQQYTKSTTLDSANNLLNFNTRTMNCAYCELPISMPVIGVSLKLNCNHLCHKICFRADDICAMCKST